MTPNPPAAPGGAPLADATVADEVRGAPWLPPGGPVELPGRGTTFVRDSGGPAGAPVVVLLHGWAVTADLNWFAAYPDLAERYRVLAIDHRGHGRGIRPPGGKVRLSDCADDVAALLDVLGIDRAIVVGYSMGGAIAQLLWRRHPDRVSGLVLCSTARHFQGGPISALWYRSYTPLAAVANAARGPAEALVRKRVERRVSRDERADWMRSELERADPAALLTSMRSVGRIRSNRWITEVDVPAAVIVTTKDRTVPARNQRKLAAAIPGAVVSEVAGPHDSIVTRTDQYLPALLTAVAQVATAASR
ncbi:alpha/beta hydrolase [Aquihabitans sp. G128]|uniref:alpha/beta fold hydrolase n=1 Tax=Aquihabitans sp. G128 TaxID=2849779 RepID=UPI001C22ED31|nr:alpha/beta hydrolase [Aquihabitans sp. G128]QXC63074.1 alpha/beta hydrolase [Aquihabitans sp. G128]